MHLVASKAWSIIDSSNVTYIIQLHSHLCCVNDNVFSLYYLYLLCPNIEKKKKKLELELGNWILKNVWAY